MPGGRSLGCRTCKQRKIKCDETHPICIQCEKAGRSCPGPLTPFIYQSEMEKVEVSQHKSKARQRPLRWRPSFELKSQSQTPVADKRPYNGRRSASTSLSPSRSVSPSASMKLVKRVVYTLDSTKGTGHDIIMCGEWMPELISHIGHNNALDAAVETLLLTHMTLISPNKSDPQQKFRAYGEALYAIRDRLDSPGDEVDVETLCAILALCTVEAIGGSDLPAFLSHSGGSAAMFQAYGPHRFKTRFRKSLLYHQAPVFIGSSLVMGHKCFLDSPEWISLFEEDCEYLGQWEELQAKLVPVYASLPALMRDIEALKTSRGNVKTLIERAWILRQRLLRLDPITTQILSDPNSTKKVQAKLSSSPFTTCYQFSSVLVVQVVLIYWRLVIIIDNVVRKLASWDPDHHIPLQELKVSSIDAADKITMSAEQGCQSLPVVSNVHAFSLPAAIAAYSGCESRKWRSGSKTIWLYEQLQKCMAPMYTGMRVMVVKYFDAAGLPLPQLEFNNS